MTLQRENHLWKSATRLLLTQKCPEQTPTVLWGFFGVSGAPRVQHPAGDQSKCMHLQAREVTHREEEPAGNVA